MTNLFGLADCNNFYVSCERLFNRSLLGRPAVVATNLDGIIVARSNEVKALGIKMATPTFDVKDIIIKNKIAIYTANFPLYGDISRRVFSTLADLTPDIEIYSIDEAFFTPPSVGTEQVEEKLIKSAREIRKTLVHHVGIPISIGLAPTKTLAKLANQFAKITPGANGVYSLIDEEHRKVALKKIDIEVIWGIGFKSAEKLRRYGIKTVGDLINANSLVVDKEMGVNGLRIAKELRGESVYEFQSNDFDRKGISSSRTFDTMIETFDELDAMIAAFITIAAEKARRQNSVVGLLTVYVRTNRFRKEEKQYKNSATIPLPTPTDDTTILIKHARCALKQIFRPGYKYKKAGVAFENLMPKDQTQSDLFATHDIIRSNKLMKALDSVNDKMGSGTLKVGSIGKKAPWRDKGALKSARYTTNWEELFVVG